MAFPCPCRDIVIDHYILEIALGRVHHTGKPGVPKPRTQEKSVVKDIFCFRHGRIEAVLKAGERPLSVIETEIETAFAGEPA